MTIAGLGDGDSGLWGLQLLDPSSNSKSVRWMSLNAARIAITTQPPLSRHLGGLFDRSILSNTLFICTPRLASPCLRMWVTSFLRMLDIWAL